MKLRLASLLSASLLSCALATSAVAQVTILDQITPLLSGSATVGGSAPSLYYGAGYGGRYDVGTVDDFTTTGAATITKVESLVGLTQNNLAAATGWQVNIYSSAAASTLNLTGDIASVLIDASNATYTSGAPAYRFDVQTNGVLSLPVNISLPAAATYFVSVIAVGDYVGEGFISYSTSGSGGQNGFIANPGEQNAGITSYGMYGDVTYRLSGSMEGASAIPEPSTYAAIFGGLALGFVGYRRHRQSKATPATAAIS